MLLAQTTSGTALLTTILVIAGIAAVLGAFGLVIVLLFRHLHASRQLLHAERMKSLEAGIPLEPSDQAQAQEKFRHNAFWISFWLVFSVPTAALSAASTATREIHASLALGIVIWLGAAAASIAAVVCATVLMIHSRTGKPDDGILKPLKLL